MNIIDVSVSQLQLWLYQAVHFSENYSGDLLMLSASMKTMSIYNFLILCECEIAC